MEADIACNTETPRSETPSALGAAVTKAANETSAEHDRAATNGKSSLYNPILPATPGENSVTDYTASARRASAISADSRNGEAISPTLQNVVESEKVSDSAKAQKNGVQTNGVVALESMFSFIHVSILHITVGRILLFQ